MDITAILETQLDGSYKGIPGGIPPFKLKEISSKNWSLLQEDLPLPLAVVKESRLQHNANVMRAFTKDWGVSLAPHGKTTMCPQIFKLQLDQGAWGITAASVNQIQVYRKFGVQRILQANQLIGRQNVRYIVEELNRDDEFDFYTLVDTRAQVDAIAAQAREFGLKRPIKVLLELGLDGHRTGCRNIESATEVLRALRSHQDVLLLSGYECFEGVVGGEPDDALKKVNDFLAFTSSFLQRMEPEDMRAEEWILSAGGSSYFDRVADVFKQVKWDKPLRVVIRSGCYITHDSGAYEQAQQLAVKRGWSGALEPALEVWSYVQSIPEKGLAFLTMGKRDCPYDVGMPLPLKRMRSGGDFKSIEGSEVTALNDQHGYLSFNDEHDVQVGDVVVCGISHPCTLFDKWKLVPVVDDDYRVVDALMTFF